MENYGEGKIGVNDLLLARGVGGGYGGFGGGYGGQGSFANPTANAVRIESGNTAQAVGFENLLDQNQFAAANKNVVDGHNRISDNAKEDVSRISDQITNQEFRNGDRLRDLEREMNANARIAAECCCDTKAAIAEAAKDAAKCCCDAQLAACKSHSEIMAAVVAENGKTRELMQATALDAANAKIVQLETINALSGHHGR